MDELLKRLIQARFQNKASGEMPSYPNVNEVSDTTRNNIMNLRNGNLAPTTTPEYDDMNVDQVQQRGADSDNMAKLKEILARGR